VLVYASIAILAIVAAMVVLYLEAKENERYPRKQEIQKMIAYMEYAPREDDVLVVEANGEIIKELVASPRDTLSLTRSRYPLPSGQLSVTLFLWDGCHNGECRVSYILVK